MHRELYQKAAGFTITPLKIVYYKLCTIRKNIGKTELKSFRSIYYNQNRNSATVLRERVSNMAKTQHDMCNTLINFITNITALKVYSEALLTPRPIMLTTVEW